MWAFWESEDNFKQFSLSTLFWYEVFSCLCSTLYSWLASPRASWVAFLSPHPITHRGAGITDAWGCIQTPETKLRLSGLHSKPFTYWAFHLSLPVFFITTFIDLAYVNEEVRGKLSLHPSLDFDDWTQVIRLGSRQPYSLSQLVYFLTFSKLHLFIFVWWVLMFMLSVWSLRTTYKSQFSVDHVTDLLR